MTCSCANGHRPARNSKLDDEREPHDSVRVDIRGRKDIRQMPQYALGSGFDLAGAPAMFAAGMQSLAPSGVDILAGVEHLNTMVFARSMLGCSRIPLVHSRASGNPLFLDREGPGLFTTGKHALSSTSLAERVPGQNPKRS